MKHIWTVLCRRSIIDSGTNLLSLFDCIEQVEMSIDKEGVKIGDRIKVPMEFDLVGFWTDDNENKERKVYVEVDLYGPDNKKIDTIFSGNHVIKKGLKRMRNVIHLQGIAVTNNGRYLFKIKFKEKQSDDFKKVSEVPLDVKINYKILDTKNNSK